MRGILRNVRSFLRDQRGALSTDIAKAAIAITFLSVIAANVMSNRIAPAEKNAMAAISGEAAKGRLIDTNATGSIVRNTHVPRTEPVILPGQARPPR
jgi:hypothetical protein